MSNPPRAPAPRYKRAQDRKAFLEALIAHGQDRPCNRIESGVATITEDASVIAVSIETLMRITGRSRQSVQEILNASGYHGLFNIPKQDRAAYVQPLDRSARYGDGISENGPICAS